MMHAPHIPGEEDPDIVVVILRQVVQMAPEFSAALARQIEHDVKAEFGGRRVYVPKDKKRLSTQQREQLHQDLRSNMTDHQITSKWGMHRATMYRSLKRPPSDADDRSD